MTVQHQEPESFGSRWWESIQATAAAAFADAIERGDLEVADRWANVLLRTNDDRQEADR